MGGFRPYLAMDTFCEVRGQSLHRRGTPVNRARCLAETQSRLQLSLSVSCILVVFVTGWAVGFVSAVIYLINS